GSEKKIEDLAVGESVLNHKNQHAKVTNVIKRKFTGNLVTISVENWDRTLTATEVHHGMIVTGNGLERMQFGFMLTGDRVLIPSDNSVRNIANTEYQYVVDREVYCITTENEYTAIFNGIAQYQCVSFGAKNAIEYVQFFPMINGERLNWTMVFPPYLYGCGRIFIGKG